MMKGSRFLVRCFLFCFGVLSLIPKSSLAGFFSKAYFFKTPALEYVSIDPSDFQMNDERYVSFPVFMESTCTSFPGMLCAPFQLVLPEGASISTESRLQGLILESFSRWNTQTLVPVRFSYLGLKAGGALPIAPGEFYISFKAVEGAMFSEGEIAKTVLKTVADPDNQKAKVVGAGIFLNPIYQEGIDYYLPSILLHSLGKVLGLGSSAVTESIMYPERSSSIQEHISFLFSDDLLFASSKYSGATPIFGELQGQVIHGETGEPIVGAHVELIPSSYQLNFSLFPSRIFSLTGTFTTEEGMFHFPKLPPGEYFLKVESQAKLPLSRSNLDPWLILYSEPTDFEIDFYDGKDRESNEEPISSFSPQSIFLAAALNVESGKKTDNIEVITNTENSSLPKRRARGSNRERLSIYTSLEGMERILSLRDASQEFPSSLDEAGGCAIQENSISPLTLFLWTIVVLILGIRARRDQKVRSSPFPYREF